MRHHQCMWPTFGPITEASLAVSSHSQIYSWIIVGVKEMVYVKHSAQWLAYRGAKAIFLLCCFFQILTLQKPFPEPILPSFHLDL